eukprot:12777705-Alexandrium_andersonii.AAC.1
MCARSRAHGATQRALRHPCGWARPPLPLHPTQDHLRLIGCNGRAGRLTIGANSSPDDARVRPHGNLLLQQDHARLTPNSR